MKRRQKVNVRKYPRIRYGKQEKVKKHTRTVTKKVPRSVQLPLFCPECGSLYIVKSRRGKQYAYCPKCKKYIPLEEVHPSISQVTQEIQPAEATIIFEEDVPLGLKRGKGKKGCPHEWDYVISQTRSGDEASTVWSICIKCGKVVKGYVPNRIRAGKHSDDELPPSQYVATMVESAQERARYNPKIRGVAGDPELHATLDILSKSSGYMVQGYSGEEDMYLKHKRRRQRAKK